MSCDGQPTSALDHELSHRDAAVSYLHLERGAAREHFGRAILGRQVEICKVLQAHLRGIKPPVASPVEFIGYLKRNRGSDDVKLDAGPRCVNGQSQTRADQANRADRDRPTQREGLPGGNAASTLCSSLIRSTSEFVGSPTRVFAPACIATRSISRVISDRRVLGSVAGPAVMDEKSCTAAG